MIKNIKQVTGLLLTLGSLLGLSSCLDEPSEGETMADQLFRPIQFTASVTGIAVNFTWVPIKGASYALEISRDSLRFQNELQVIALDSTTAFTVSDLWSSSRYSARIKAVSKNSDVKDSGYQTITFTTGIENVFISTGSTAIKANSVQLAWDSTKVVTDIKVFIAEQLQSTIPLTTADITRGSRLIDGLKPKTTYSFKIYNGEKLRGTAAVTTAP
jgi:hypothetical protein